MADSAHSEKLIFVVEDDRELAEVLAEALREARYRVRIAADGSEALRLLHSSERPSLMLIDLEMPRMNGVDLCIACRQDPALDSIPRILMSASFQRFRGRLDECRAAAQLEKPIKVEELLNAMASLPSR